MRKQTKIRFCMALVVLALTLGIVGGAEQNAIAAPCCSACDYQQDNCEAGIIYPWCGGDPNCCAQEVANRCWRWCIECG